MAKINNIGNTDVGKDMDKAPLTLLVGMQTGAPLWTTVWRFLRKLKMELSWDLAIALLGIYPKNTKMLISRDTCTPMFIAALFIMAKLWKQPKYPSIDKKDVVHIHNRVLLSHKKKSEILPFVTPWTELDSTMLSKRRKIPYDLTHVWNLKNKWAKKKKDKPRNIFLTIENWWLPEGRLEGRGW